MPIDDSTLERDLLYLQAELARIDILVRRQVSRIELTTTEEGAQDQARVDEVWRERYQRAGQHAQALAASAERGTETLKLVRLARIFQLDAFELDAFLIVLAPALDEKYADLCAYLQSNTALAAPRVSLILDLLCESTTEKWQMLARFSDHAPLMRYLIAEGDDDLNSSPSRRLRRVLNPDPAIVDWLLGSYHPRGILHPHAYLVQPQNTDPIDLVISGDVWPQISQGLCAQTIACFYGPDRDCQAAVARRLADAQARPLLTVDLEAASNSGIVIERAIHLALRDAKLTDSIVHFAGLDVCLQEGDLSGDLLRQFDEHPDLIITSGAIKWRPKDGRRDGTIFWQEFPIPSYAQRKNLWRHLLGECEKPSDDEITELAGQFHLSSSQTRDIFDAARDTAAQQGVPISGQELFAAARDYSGANMETLATKIKPRYQWSDLILPPDYLQILHEIVATVRSRPKVLEEWGLGQKLVSSSAITMLFAGEPGTGKTMAAEVIAHALNIDVFKINLANIVSKYIGETEKNLEKIFTEAEQSHAILFFDEADSIFGKRTAVKDSHDRYANVGISYLLQRMEIYDGITILATNLRSNLDEAFTRRLQFLVDFPFPEAEYRLRIWQALFPPSLPRDPDLDFTNLAKRLKVAGGNIRNIIVTAAYLAADQGTVVTSEILHHAVRRELQKMGRIIDDRNFYNISDSIEKKEVPQETLENLKLKREVRG